MEGSIALKIAAYYLSHLTAHRIGVPLLQNWLHHFRPGLAQLCRRRSDRAPDEAAFGGGEIGHDSHVLRAVLAPPRGAPPHGSIPTGELIPAPGMFAQPFQREVRVVLQQRE